MLTPSQAIRRDWYLHQLGIIQYDLRNSNVFCGKSQLPLSKAIRLIVIAENVPLESPFFTDIMHTINITASSVLLLNPTQAALLPNNLPCVIWRIGTARPPNLPTKSSAIIETETITQLMNSTQKKRLLWQKLCQYDNYFQT